MCFSAGGTMRPKSKEEQELPKKVISNPLNFLAFGLGSGLAPIAPGTAGTLAAIPIYLWISQFSLDIYLAIIAISFVIGIFLCGYSSDNLGVHDHPGIVWDEFVGYWITMIAVPATWGWIVTGFILFRIFDIWKPFPIKTVDKKVTGGFGIMLDDVLAGIYAAAVLQVLMFTFS